MLNFESIGIPICEIKHNGSSSKKRPPVISMSSFEEENSVRQGFTKYDLLDDRGKDFHFEVAINDSTERQICYITGSSGSGKSYWTKRYVDSYKKVYPTRQIYLFSSINEDASVDCIKDLHRIKITPELLTDELTAKDFENSMVIFDDVDTLQNKALRKVVMNIQSDILQCGRHYNVSAIITSHVATNGNDTRLILNECHSLTFFPHGMNGRSLKYLLETYLGMDKHEIKRIKSLQGRAVSFIKTFPKVVVSDKDVLILKNL